MALPGVIPCKVSDEAAGYLSTAPVNRVDLTSAELVGKIVGVCGKNPERVARILARGSLVNGDLRFRWVGVGAAAGEIEEFLKEFPEDDPSRTFDPQQCLRIVFHGPRGRTELTREAGRQTRALRRRNFWDEALPLLARLPLRYERYSYSDGCDVFAADLSREAAAGLRDSARLLRYTILEAQIKNLDAASVSFYQPR